MKAAPEKFLISLDFRPLHFLQRLQISGKKRKFRSELDQASDYNSLIRLEKKLNWGLIEKLNFSFQKNNLNLSLTQLLTRNTKMRFLNVWYFITCIVIEKKGQIFQISNTYCFSAFYLSVDARDLSPQKYEIRRRIGFAALFGDIHFGKLDPGQLGPQVTLLARGNFDNVWTLRVALIRPLFRQLIALKNNWMNFGPNSGMPDSEWVHRRVAVMEI